MILWPRSKFNWVTEHNTVAAVYHFFIYYTRKNVVCKNTNNNIDGPQVTAHWHQQVFIPKVLEIDWQYFVGRPCCSFQECWKWTNNILLGEGVPSFWFRTGISARTIVCQQADIISQILTLLKSIYTKLSIYSPLLLFTF